MAEAHLVMFECPRCGRHTKALPKAEIWCPCGRKMGRRGKQAARTSRAAQDATL